MVDLQEWMVYDFAKYYDLKGQVNFKAYFATLGLFDRTGRSKSAWEVLKTEGPRLTARRATNPGPRKLPSAPQRSKPRPPI